MRAQKISIEIRTQIFTVALSFWLIEKFQKELNCKVAEHSRSEYEGVMAVIKYLNIGDEYEYIKNKFVKHLDDLWQDYSEKKYFPIANVAQMLKKPMGKYVYLEMAIFRTAENIEDFVLYWARALARSESVLRNKYEEQEGIE